MESPISSVRYIHRAIRTEAESLEDAVAQLRRDDGARAAGLARRFDFLYGFVKSHEDGEEDALFPVMDERIYPVSAPYLLDHRTGQRDMREIAESFDRLSTVEDAGERAWVLRRLSRQAIVVSSAMALHIRKEEDILVPLIEQHFSIEEQKGIVNQAVAHFTPEQQQRGFPWIMKALTPQEQEDYLRMLMQEMPPEVFRALTRWISDGVPPMQWEEIVRRIPEAA
jgi:hemerythrin-like domain-containing protein